MKPAPFEYYRAKSVDDAVAALGRQGPGAMLLAGGQSLIPLMNFRLSAPDAIVDIGRLDELNFIRETGGILSIGAVTTHNAVFKSELVAKHCPLIVAAYAYVAHHTIRNRGTIGGNLCHNDPASEMPLVMTLLDATMVLRGPSGERSVPAADFFVGLMETAKAADELLTEIRIPVQKAGDGYAFEEVSPRKGDFAIVSAGCLLTLADGKCTDVRLGFTGAGEKTKRIAEAEAVLEGQPPSDGLVARALDVAVDKAQPSGDVHADTAYKLDLIRTLGRRVLHAALGKMTAGG